MSDDASARPGRLILVPAIITLAVTLLRLVGELQGWSPRFFSKEAGGGGALVGIAWLVPVFGAWFGWKLARAGERPGALGRALGLTVLALALLPASGFVAGSAGHRPDEPRHASGSSRSSRSRASSWPSSPGPRSAACCSPTASRRGSRSCSSCWPPSSATGARTTTSRRLAPPRCPASGSGRSSGLLPQMTIWLWFTSVIGGIVGIVAGAIAAAAGLGLTHHGHPGGRTRAPFGGAPLLHGHRDRDVRGGLPRLRAELLPAAVVPGRAGAHRADLLRARRASSRPGWCSSSCSPRWWPCAAPTCTASSAGSARAWPSPWWPSGSSGPWSRRGAPPASSKSPCPRCSSSSCRSSTWSCSPRSSAWRSRSGATPRATSA